MDNYERAREQAEKRFLEYDPKALLGRPGVRIQGDYLMLMFLGTPCRVDLRTGAVASLRETGWQRAGFGETLSVLDWLCDRKPDAVAAEEFCPVASLPKVFVGGSGLSMTGGQLPGEIESAPGAFCRAIRAMGGVEVPLGDIGFRLPVFSDLPMCLKFYYGDSDFPPSLTFLWDKNTLRFVRYETVYYIAGCLCERIHNEINPLRDL